MWDFEVSFSWPWNTCLMKWRFWIYSGTKQFFYQLFYHYRIFSIYYTPPPINTPSSFCSPDQWFNGNDLFKTNFAFFSVQCLNRRQTKNSIFVHFFYISDISSSIHYLNKAGYTATLVACRWAGAVIKKTNPIIRAEAVTQKPPVTRKKLTRTDGLTEHPTDGHSGLSSRVHTTS